MGLAEEIYKHSLSLSPESARTALEFIEFLKERSGAVPRPSAGTSPTEEFLARHAGALGEDFPDDVEDGDLAPDAPRQALE